MTERRRDEKRISAALQELEAPDEHVAEERARQVVEAAFAERDPAEPRRRVAVRAGLAALAALAVGGFALTPAGAEVREWIADRVNLGVEESEPRLGELPTSGSLLVESNGGVWTVSADGARRRLGDYDLATWSPSALFAGVTDGPEVSALTPQGDVRWVRPASARVTGLDWSTDDGDRVAYLVGKRELRVMAADSSSDSLLAKPVSAVTPAWRPDLSSAEIERQLAYVTKAGHVRAVDLNSGRELFRHRPFFEVRAIEWNLDGSMLLMEGRESLALRYAPKTAMGWGPGSGEPQSVKARWVEAAMSPVHKYEIAAVSRFNGRSHLELLRQSAGEEIISVRSRVSDVTWSPDGNWIVLGLPDADQWLFVRRSDGEVRAVSNVAEQFGSISDFPRIAGWCCTP